MNNTNMDTQNSQEMTPEEAKSSLGVANMLMEQLMPQKQMEMEAESDQTQETAPGQEQMEQPNETPPIDSEGLKNEIMVEVGKTIEESIQKEMGGLRDMIKQALIDEEE